MAPLAMVTLVVSVETLFMVQWLPRICDHTVPQVSGALNSSSKASFQLPGSPNGPELAGCAAGNTNPDAPEGAVAAAGAAAAAGGVCAACTVGGFGRAGTA